MNREVTTGEGVQGAGRENCKSVANPTEKNRRAFGSRTKLDDCISSVPAKHILIFWNHVRTV